MPLANDELRGDRRKRERAGAYQGEKTDRLIAKLEKLDAAGRLSPSQRVQLGFLHAYQRAHGGDSA